MLIIEPNLNNTLVGVRTLFAKKLQNTEWGSTSPATIHLQPWRPTASDWQSRRANLWSRDSYITNHQKLLSIVDTTVFLLERTQDILAGSNDIQIPRFFTTIVTLASLANTALSTTSVEGSTATSAVVRKYHRQFLFC